MAAETGNTGKLNVSPERFRAVLRHVPTNVTVVAGIVDGAPVGLSVGSFVAVSLEPALVGFFVAETSTSWPGIEASGLFCVNVLAEDQASVSSRFALSSSVLDKFEGVSWRPAPSGSPILDGVVAWVDCAVHERLQAGDHVLVLGKVNDLGVENGGTPLLHHRGGYRRAHDLAPEAESLEDEHEAEPDLASNE